LPASPSRSSRFPEPATEATFERLGARVVPSAAVIRRCERSRSSVRAPTVA
jgi:hypothetical protein